LVYFYADADIPSAFGISNNAKWSRLEVKTSNNRIESIQLRDEAPPNGVVEYKNYFALKYMLM
jgi:hypothetical protein